MMMNPLPKKLTHGGGGHNHNRLARKLACCGSDELSTLDRASFVDRLIEEEMRSTASIRELIAEHKKKREQNFNLGHTANAYNSNHHSNDSGDCSSSPTSAMEDDNVTKHRRKRGKSKSKRSKIKPQKSQRGSVDKNQQQDQQKERTKSATTSKNRKRQQEQPLAEHLQKSAAIGRSSLESVDDSMIPRALSIVSSSTHSPVSRGDPVSNTIPALDKTRTITKLILGHDSPIEVIRNMKSSPTIRLNSPPKYENESLMVKSKQRSEEPLFLVKEKNTILTMIIHKKQEEPDEQQVKLQSTTTRRSSKSCPSTGKMEEKSTSITDSIYSSEDVSLPSKEDIQQVKTALSTAVIAEDTSKNHTIKCLQFDPTTTYGSIYTLQKGFPVVIRKTDGTVNNTCIFTMPPEANQEEEKRIAKCSVAKDSATSSTANRRTLLKKCNSPRNNNKTPPPTGRSPSLTKRRIRILASPADQQQSQRRNSDPEISVGKDITKQSDAQQQHVLVKPQPPRWFRP